MPRHRFIPCMTRLLDRKSLLVLFVSLLLTAGVKPVAARQGAEEGGTPAEPAKRPEMGIRIDPMSGYTPTYGLGVNVFLAVRHLPLPDSRIGLHIYPSIRRRLAYVDAMIPFAAGRSVYFSGHALVEQNRRHVFFGSGPHAERANGVDFDRNGAEAEGRLGLETPGGRFLIQPLARIERQTVLEVNQPGSPAWSALQNDPSTRPHLPVFDRAESVWGVGLETMLDLRDRRAAPKRGVAAEARFVRYASRTLPDLRFDRMQLGAHFAIPLFFEHVFSARALLVETRNRGTDALPFYLLPTLDHHRLPGYGHNRFQGMDLLVFNFEYRAPVAELFELYRVEALVHAGAGSVYDSLSEQFRAAISLDRRIATGDKGVPLRPGVGLGLSVASLANDRMLLHWIVGWSPDRVTALPMRFEFTADLRHPRPTFR